VPASDLGTSSFNGAFDKRCALDLRTVRFIAIGDAVGGGAAHHAPSLGKMDFDAKPLQLIGEQQDLRMIPAQAVQRTYDQRGYLTLLQALQRVEKLSSVEHSTSFDIAVDCDKINPHACRIFFG
jgi:hypothetical protein